MRGLAVWILGIATALAQKAEKRPAPFTVCELIEKRVEYNGQLVTLRGEVKNGPHGGWLEASPECQFRLVTKGVTWANRIFLAYPHSKPRSEEDQADFQVDWKSVRKAEGVIKHERVDSATDLFVTYVGRFVTRLDLDRYVNSPSLGGNMLGFGPVGLDAPAQSLIKGEYDAVAIHGRR